MYGQMPYYANPTSQTAQQRLQMLESQYPQFAGNPPMGYPSMGGYPNSPQQPSQAAPILKGRPVSNEEEANAAMIDFDGSLFVFPDKAHGKIYTKQLGLDGNIVFLRYSLDMEPKMQPSTAPVLPQDLSEYVTRDTLDKSLGELKDKLASLEQKISTSTKGGSKG